AGMAEVALAYFVARDAFGVRALWREIDALDNRVPAQVQTRLLLAVAGLLERCTLWLLRNLPSPVNPEATIRQIRPAIEQLGAQFDQLLPEYE
ncbi:hypothetical protein, partial [Klebsiella pneumoniae]